MTAVSKRWPRSMNSGLDEITNGDLDKKRQLWEHIAKQTSVLHKLRSTDTDEQIVNILTTKEKACVKSPGKSARHNAKAITRAKAKPATKVWNQQWGRRHTGLGV